MVAGISSAAAAIAFAGATPVVTGVTMTQPSDSRRVTITYTMDNAPAVVTLDVQTNRTGTATEVEADWVSIGGEFVSNAKGDVWRKVTEADTKNGVYTIVWNPDQSWPDHKIDNKSARAVVTAWALDNTPDYMVVDLTATGGAGTQRYYPGEAFLPGVVPGKPGAITNNALYKTSCMVMRKIMAKDVRWTMGSTASEPIPTGHAARETAHIVELTNNYYIGVFEVTQDQWTLVKGACDFVKYKHPCRPVENVSFVMARIADATCTVDANSPFFECDWPSLPGADSFLDKIRAKTGIDFDLPSEAQWEFAARAGNGVNHWNDGSVMNVDSNGMDTNLDRLGRYNVGGDAAVTVKTSEVGSYKPNEWGLYDMHGNVLEWCLDWFKENITGLEGAVNVTPISGRKVRVQKGGSWNEGALYCRAAYRRDCDIDAVRPNVGIRLCCTGGLK